MVGIHCVTVTGEEKNFVHLNSQTDLIAKWQQRRMRFVVLKVSGEWLGKDDNYHKVALMILALLMLGVQVAIVVGGGSLCRGVEFEKNGYSKEDADRCGMKATEFIGMRLRLELLKLGSKAVVLSAVPTSGVEERYTPGLCKQYMEQGVVPIMVGGIDVPYTNTDVKAALVAAGIGATLLMAKSNTDYLYNMDPRVNRGSPLLEAYEQTTYDVIIRERLDAMPVFAADILEQARVVTFFFNADEPDVLKKLVEGRRYGTIITAKQMMDVDFKTELGLFNKN